MDTAKEMEALKVKGGLLGRRVLTAGEVRSLAQLPPLPVVRGRLVGVLQAPASRMVGVLAGSARQMVGVLKAYAEKGAGGAQAAGAAA
jgi:large subunit ribosomal protein L10